VDENQAGIAELEQRLRLLDAERRALAERLELLRRSLSPHLEPLGWPAVAQVPTTAEEKVALFLSLFRCREDVFPKLWENPRKGTSGYSPACRNEWVPGKCEKPKTKCSECPNQAFLALDAEAVEAHLRGNCTVGSYAIRADDTCTFLACDFDGDGWQDGAVSYRQVGMELGIDAALERSRSGNGAHAWLFFSEPVPARLARRLGTLLLARALDRRPQISFRSFDRFFPNQDFLPKGGFGNLIALPLQRTPRERGNSVFLVSDIEPAADQWEYLARIRRLGLNDVESVLRRIAVPEAVSVRDGTADAELSDIRADDWLLAAGDRDRGLQMAGRAVTIRVDSQLTISLDDLPPRLVGRLKRLAAFPNPEFYKLNRMRLPTYPHPRIIFSGELQTDQLVLPRGVLDAAVQVLRSAGAVVSVQDERQRPKRLRLGFRGTLTPDQQKAVRVLRKSEFGVFVAPPGAGKTVVACALIALRKTPTLILMHRQPLVEQWRSRLTEFLDVSDREIGSVSGTKKRATGKVDIAMLQTLSRADGLGRVLPHYGQVVVDECHHIPALSFEAVLRQLPATFILGLTATPYRKDGLQKIIHFQCGPVRHEIRTADGGVLSKRVCVRETGFRTPESAGPKAPIHVIWHHLVTDVARTEMIADDVVQALLKGKVPLVISDRRDHLQSLSEEIKKQVCETPVRVFRLDGEMPLPARKRLMSELHSALEQKQKACLLSTASLIGEGFDLPALDTLFLAMPISFKGRIVQYAGRLHRLHEGKRDVEVYDYVDSHCAMALKMYRNRLRAYRDMGYAVEEPAGMVGSSRPRR
jgi:superfamily II DNA or RNA helicase